jgi:hypothetical protein
MIILLGGRNRPKGRCVPVAGLEQYSETVGYERSGKGTDVHIRRAKENLLTETTTDQGSCQVRSGTDRPCYRPAVARIWGIPFCEPCAREQEAYFAIGELTEPEEKAGGENLVAVMGLMKKRRLRSRMALPHEPRLLSHNLG